MSLTLFDPFADVSRLRQQIDRLVDESTRPQKAQNGGRVWRPTVDLFETQEALELRLDLPGVDRSSLDIQLTDDELVVKGERKWVAEERSTCVHSERPYGQFQRAFKVGLPVQHDKVEASYKDGVLTVLVPKAETAKPRKIAVKSEGE
ncbi:MAG: Hsp20/alpha crystallin family protein [Actinomycetota bacterium]